MSPSPLMTTEEVAEYLGEFSVRTLEHWRRIGVGPDFIKIRGNVRYRPAAVERWLDQHERKNTAA